MSDPHAPSVLCTVDAVLFTLRHASLHVLLARREQAPFQNAWALPGGFIHPDQDEDAKASALRVLDAKAGVQVPYLEQLATFSGAVRDPRGWSLAVVYCALVPLEQLQVQTLRQEVQLFDVQALPPLPFDHGAIVQQALERVRSKSQYSSLPVHLCGEQFTLPQLQATYEAVLGETINKVSFRRKMDELGMLEPVPGAMQGGAHRPAQVYRLRPAFRRSLSLSQRSL